MSLSQWPPNPCICSSTNTGFWSTGHVCGIYLKEQYFNFFSWALSITHPRFKCKCILVHCALSPTHHINIGYTFVITSFTLRWFLRVILHFKKMFVFFSNENKIISLYLVCRLRCIKNWHFLIFNNDPDLWLTFILLVHALVFSLEYLHF